MLGLGKLPESVPASARSPWRYFPNRQSCDPGCHAATHLDSFSSQPQPDHHTLHPTPTALREFDFKTSNDPLNNPVSVAVPPLSPLSASTLTPKPPTAMRATPSLTLLTVGLSGLCNLASGFAVLPFSLSSAIDKRQYNQCEMVREIPILTSPRLKKKKEEGLLQDTAR